jgi:hypothetical protein
MNLGQFRARTKNEPDDLEIVLRNIDGTEWQPLTQIEINDVSYMAVTRDQRASRTAREISLS